MKRLFFVLLAVVALAVLALTLGRSRPGKAFATPDDCLAAYYDAAKDGDGAAYLNCLAAPLRAQTEGRFRDEQALSGWLRQSMQDLKNWVQSAAPAPAGASAEVEVEESWPTGNRRLRFHLQRSGSGWLIDRIESDKERPAPVPYGTDVRQAPEEP
jgi:hypothetical protein